MPIHPPARIALRAALAVIAAAGLLGLAACDSEDVTGEPEDIGKLIHVIPSGSRCVHDAGADSVHFYVALRNTGGDERTVQITPVRRFSDGEDVGSSIDGFSMKVPGKDDAEGDLEVDGVSDDLTGCLVQIDSGDPVQIAIQQQAG